MPKGRKRRLPPGFDLRLFFSHARGALWLVGILNKHDGDWWANRLSQLVSDINELHDIAARNQFPSRNRMLRPPLRKTVAEIFERIDSQFAGAEFRTRLLYPTAQGWRREWRPRKNDSHDVERALFDLATAAVADMAAVGELAKIRQCGFCHRWFAGRQRKCSTRFCSDHCRDAHHRRDPARRQYMRKYLAIWKRERRRQLRAG
jgi:hypothetical protein